jgi:hypothetical protein
MSRSPRRSIAGFDSATAMLRAVASFLHDRDMRALGAVPRPLAPLAERVVPLVNLLPDRAREAIYSAGSGHEAVPPEHLDEVDGEAVARWMTEQYPQRRYPAVAIGSSSGALAHLCAAIGMPFLPTTFLVPVRQREVDPDDARAAMEAGLAGAARLLAANPELDLHHMHDPNQDRLSLRRMTYFRVKRRTLGPAFTRFLRERLEPGGLIVISDCRLRWPVTRIGDRHVFQFGALGGMEPDEFHAGSPRVADYLARYGSSRRRWDPPPADEEAPESEWGLGEALRDDLRHFAAAHHLRLSTLSFDDPEQLSPEVADVLRAWHRREGRPAQRLLVESFVLLDPWWSVRLGAVPLWLKFPVQPSADRLERYLDESEPYDEISLALFSHGTESVGLTPIDRWRALVTRAARQGRLLGVDARRYPRDFASFTRFNAQLRRLGPQLPMPEPLPLSTLDRLAAASAVRSR